MFNFSQDQRPSSRTGERSSVAFVEHSAVLTGGQVSCLNLARIALDKGARVGLLYPLGGSMQRAVERRFQSGEITVKAGPDIFLNDVSKTLADVFRMLWYVMSAVRFLPFFAKHDVIYISSSRWFVPAFFISHLLRRRFVYHVRIDHNVLEKRLVRIIVRSSRTHAVVVNTEFVLERLLQRYPELRKEKKLQLLRTPLFPPFSGIPFDAERFERRAGPGTLTVAVIGRLTPSKGQDILINIAPALPQVRFVVIGCEHPGFASYFVELRRGCPETVTFYGETDDIPASLRQIGAHVSLVPSRWDDPFPLVAVESISCSCIGLVRRKGGLTSLAERLELHAFDEDDEAIALLQALAAMGNDELRALAQRQHEALHQQFPYERFVEQFGRLCFSD